LKDTPVSSKQLLSRVKAPLKAWGRTVAKVRAPNPRNESLSEELELLVDTGSTYTRIEREKLERLGVRSAGKRSFKTIGNGLIEREVGEAVIECLNRRATKVVVFAERGG